MKIQATLTLIEAMKTSTTAAKKTSGPNEMTSDLTKTIFHTTLVDRIQPDINDQTIQMHKTIEVLVLKTRVTKKYSNLSIPNLRFESLNKMVKEIQMTSLGHRFFPNLETIECPMMLSSSLRRALWLRTLKVNSQTLNRLKIHSQRFRVRQPEFYWKMALKTEAVIIPLAETLIL